MSDDNPYDDGSGFPVETVDFNADFRTEEQVTEPEYSPEGLYHVSVSEMDCSGKSFAGAVFMSLSILSGNVEGQVGKNLRYVIWPPKTDSKNPEASKRRWKKTILRLMLVFGLRKHGEFPTVVFNDDWWHGFEGKQCIVATTLQKQSRKTESGRAVEWIVAAIADIGDFYRIGDEAVADVPLDVEAAKVGGYIGSIEDI